jgi:nickel-dependent lactate racemase
MQKLAIRTGAWYGDKQIELEIPDTWDISVFNPQTQQPISDVEILEKLKQPVGRLPLRKLCIGKAAPLIIVDDLNRPTPASRVLPLLLKIFCEENISLSNVTILMATGTHGAPPPDAMVKKVGVEAASKCKVLIHDCFYNVTKIGKTSFGTPVIVNKAILKSDLVISIGGIYPNHTAGFGGGSKIVLGILGMRSIFHLHYCHPSAEWGSVGSNSTFRKDLDEIADMVKLQMSISLQINAQREVTRMDCGDQKMYFPDAVEYCKKVFTVPSPHDADVVISNTYPNDLSLTFARMKGFVPLSRCKSAATRITIASCGEGVGLHNIYPYMNIPSFFKIRHVSRVLSMMSYTKIIQTIFKRIRRVVSSENKTLKNSDKFGNTPNSKNPIWLFRPGQQNVNLPSELPGLRIKSKWNDILQAVNLEQGENKKLKVVIYPCAFLQCISSEINISENQDHASHVNNIYIK